MRDGVRRLRTRHKDKAPLHTSVCAAQLSASAAGNWQDSACTAPLFSLVFHVLIRSSMQLPPAFAFYPRAAAATYINVAVL